VKRDGAGPQAWHNDGCPDGLLRGILYMTDVDERSGAFQYKNKNGEVVSVNGPRGTLAIFDADQVLHRGSPPLDRHREAFDLTFSPRMNGEPMMAFADGTSIFPNDPFMFSINSTIGDPSAAITVNRPGVGGNSSAKEQVGPRLKAWRTLKHASRPQKCAFSGKTRVVQDVDQLRLDKQSELVDE
jgi:hypothetical protein